MKRLQKIILTFLILPIFLFSFNVRAATIDNSATLIAQLQQEVESLINQIIVLLQQQIKLETNSNLQTGTQNNSGGAVLTVNAVGTTAYVSVNNGAQFVYASPITLNNGDTYSVTASLNNSTSKCSGTAWSGGSYVCNINLNSN